MVSRIFASWNQLNQWLRQIERLRRAAWVNGQPRCGVARRGSIPACGSGLSARPGQNDRDLADPEDGFVIVQAEW